MQEHLKLLTTYRENNVAASLWKVAYFNAAGDDLGTVYELEVSNTTGTIRFDESELKGFRGISAEALLFMEQRADEYPVESVA